VGVKGNDIVKQESTGREEQSSVTIFQEKTVKKDGPLVTRTAVATTGRQTDASD
jgi:hypothetical protein